MGEEGAIVESPEGAADVPAPAARDDAWLDDDGRDHGKEPSPAIASAMWWCIGAGIMLLLPRQWASAGIAFAIAIVLAIVKRRRHPPAKPEEEPKPKPEDEPKPKPKEEPPSKKEPDKAPRAAAADA